MHTRTVYVFDTSRLRYICIIHEQRRRVHSNSWLINDKGRIVNKLIAHLQDICYLYLTMYICFTGKTKTTNPIKLKCYCRAYLPPQYKIDSLEKCHRISLSVVVWHCEIRRREAEKSLGNLVNHRLHNTARPSLFTNTLILSLFYFFSLLIYIAFNCHNINYRATIVFGL